MFEQKRDYTGKCWRSSETENTIRNGYNIVSILFPPLLNLLTLPSSQKVPCPYSPSVIYRNGRKRAIWRGRSRHSAPARQSFPITSLLTATLRQYCSLTQRPSDSGLDSDGLFITGSAAAHIPYSGGRTRVYFLAAGVAALF